MVPDVCKDFKNFTGILQGFSVIWFYLTDLWEIGCSPGCVTKLRIDFSATKRDIAVISQCPEGNFCYGLQRLKGLKEYSTLNLSHQSSWLPITVEIFLPLNFDMIPTSNSDHIISYRVSFEF